jgi:hypothetical protein
MVSVGETRSLSANVVASATPDEASSALVENQLMSAVGGKHAKTCNDNERAENLPPSASDVALHNYIDDAENNMVASVDISHDVVSNRLDNEVIVALTDDKFGAISDGKVENQQEVDGLLNIVGSGGDCNGNRMDNDAPVTAESVPPVTASNQDPLSDTVPREESK